MLRTISNYAHYTATAEALRVKTSVEQTTTTRYHDIGSKYAQLIPIIQRNSPATAVTSWRPNLNSYDTAYLATHPVKLYNSQDGISARKNDQIIVNKFDSSQVNPSESVMCNDAIWYPGVASELFKAAIKGANVYSANPVYTNVKGIYDYPDHEGQFTVYEENGIAMVNNRPNGNDVTKGYTHPLCHLPIERGYVTLWDYAFEDPQPDE